MPISLFHGRIRSEQVSHVTHRFNAGARQFCLGYLQRVTVPQRIASGDAAGAVGGVSGINGISGVSGDAVGAVGAAAEHRAL